MSKIIEALKALYVKLGGTASTVADVTQTPDMINAIAGLDIGGGGEIADNAVTTSKIADGNVTEAKLESTLAEKVNATELPAVTGSDNGSVLTVVEGAWAKAAAPSGNDAFVVNFTSGGSATLTGDKTYSELINAANDGKDIVFKNEKKGYLLFTSITVGSSIVVNAIGEQGSNVHLYSATASASASSNPITLS